MKLFPWAAHRTDTANIKLSVELNHGNMLPAFVALSDGNENDMVQERKIKFPKGSIVAFNKGYVDYQWFGNLTKQGVSFFTRLRPKAAYEVLECNPADITKGISSAQVIQLNSAHALKRGAPKLRRVEYDDKESGRNTYS